MSLYSTLSTLIDHPLAKSSRIRVLLKFLRWQFGIRLIEGDVICSWIHGAKFIARKGETGITGNLYFGLHEFEDMMFLLHVLRKEDLFVDVGANVGSYTILASAVVGAKSISFEPIPETFERLCANVLINNIGSKVVTCDKAIGSRSEELVFSSNENCTNHALTNGEVAPDTTIVEVTTLDKELVQAPIVIKIDVEGFEIQALKGASKILSDEKLCAIILELNGSGERYGVRDDEISGLLISYGFKSYSYNPYGRNLLELDTKNDDRSNTLFIRNQSFLQERLKESPVFKVAGNTI